MATSKRPAGKPEEMKPEVRAAVLDKLGEVIAGLRAEAIKGRQMLGIEKDWQADEEFYQGFDDANRHEFQDIKSKPGEGGRSTDVKTPKGSTLFPNITQPYVDAAAAKVADMLLPTDDRNFVVEPTPVPDILDEEEGWPEIVPEAVPQGAPAPGLLGAAAPGMPPQAAAMAQLPPPGPQPATPAAGIMADPAAAAAAEPADPLAAFFAKLKEVKEKAQAAAERFQDQVDDYLTECSFHGELRRVIDDCARIGTGVVKGPVATKQKVKIWAKNPVTGDREMVVKTKTVPGSKRVDPWNCFPDASCGDDIHAGEYFFERDFLTKKKLSALKGGQGPAAYLDSQIDKVIAEGPNKRDDGAARGWQQDKEFAGSDVYAVWYFYGTVTGEDLTAAGCHCDDQKKLFHVIVTMVNDTVIKAVLNPLESGEFPFDMLAWKNRPNMPYGSGVARQGRTAQRIVTAATRNLMDNAGASAKPHKVMSDGITQDGDPWTWVADSDSLSDVSKSMMFFVQPSLQAELMAIIQMGERMMELHTGLPMIILGMQGNVQETAAGRALQNNNGSTVLRRIARNFDNMTERHIRRYHVWEMSLGEDDTLKGDFQVKARGSSALVERDLQNQQLPNIMAWSANPMFGLDPELTAEEALKAQRFDPKAFKLSDKKKAEMAAQVQPPPMPQVEVAKIREEGETARLDKKLAHDAQQGDFNRKLEEMAVNVDAQLRSAELSVEERLALDDIKATLAGITVKVRAQQALGVMKTGAQVLTPPTEPAGRAEPGRAFEQ
jgi:hypothetical protein